MWYQARYSGGKIDIDIVRRSFLIKSKTIKIEEWFLNIYVYLGFNNINTTFTKHLLYAWNCVGDWNTKIIKTQTLKWRSSQLKREQITAINNVIAIPRDTEERMSNCFWESGLGRFSEEGSLSLDLDGESGKEDHFR